ncbi:glycolate oxidase subunit GlcF [Devosia sp. ZW T5_3]|uniref:glycolate oxidase subunit GlcF n=1 Tax=Devosia sp. ZW T5_3 TaxID=3378085 RepID=UPI0038547093
MQTNFSATLLEDPQMAASEKIVRTCVHCGFCTATCPTYVLGGDELDSPRGRIYLIKDMLEGEKPASEQVVKHVDRCLSCLSCVNTCPSGVNYMHLVDHAREYIERTYRRPLPDRVLRWVLGRVLPNPLLFRAAIMIARPFRPLADAIARLPAGDRLAAMIKLAPDRLPRSVSAKGSSIAVPHKRVVVLKGCAQSVLDPEINAATDRLLRRHGVETVPVGREGCCGALNHHLGQTASSHAAAKRNIDAWTAEMDGQGLDAIVITASGCGTTIKDYGFIFRDDPAYAEKAARISSVAKDISEFLSELELKPLRATGQVVAYHSACSLQHGQQVKDPPKRLLRSVGFVVKDVPEGHICCGSAGTYNILQPGIAAQLRDRKIANIAKIKPQIIAAGNIGCLTQIGSAAGVPVIHTVKLLDWATGGPLPKELEGL